MRIPKQNEIWNSGYHDYLVIMDAQEEMSDIILHLKHIETGEEHLNFRLKKHIFEQYYYLVKEAPENEEASKIYTILTNGEWGYLNDLELGNA